MKRNAVLLIAFLFAFTAAAADTQRYIVGTKHAVRAGALGAVKRVMTRELDPAGVTAFQSFDGFAADLTSEEAAALRQSEEVRWIEPVRERHALAIQRDIRGQTVPYGITAVGARLTAAAHASGAVNVAIIDTGIDYGHPELQANYRGGVNIIGGTNDPFDDEGHGTHVAGTIGAADNGQGVIGVAPNIRIWSVKMLDSSGSGTSEGLIKSIDWVVDKKHSEGGNWVVNLSLGAKEESAGEREAFQRAADAGIIVVAASGNSSTPGVPGSVAFPAAYPTVLAVAAIDSTQTLATFSSQGPEVDLSAPGVNVLSTLPRGSDTISYMLSGPDTVFISALTGSKLGVVTGEYVYCGIGGTAADFPTSVNGRIALIQRGGDITFADKARHAKAAGAVGVAIFNNDDSTNRWTLISDMDASTFAWPVTVRLARTEGEALVNKGSGTITIAYTTDDYGEKSGTSMACPHVVGAAALLWTLAPNASAAQVTNALLSTATDLGAPGQDSLFGNGAVNVYAAAKMLAPQSFIPGPTTGRGLGRRGSRP
jgi:serine protease